MSTALISFGFYPSRYDPSLFVFHSRDVTLVLLVYVDDIIVTGSNSHAFLELITTLQTKFVLKNLSPLHYFLGIEISQTKSGLHLNQAKYIRQLLTQSNMHLSNPCPSLMLPNLQLSKNDGEPMADPHLYRSTVGALRYATITRLNLTFAVNKVSQFMHNPTTTHWSAVK